MAGKKRIDVDIERLKYLYEQEGATIESISKELNCNKCTVASRIKEYGLHKKKFVSKEFLEELYIKRKLTSVEIASIIGVKHPSSVIKSLHKFNIPVKAMGRRYDISREDLNNLYTKEHKSCSEISAIMGVSVSVIRRRLNKYNIPMRGRKVRKGKLTGPLKNVSREELKDLYINQNKTAEEIGVLYNVSISIVRVALNRFNIRKEHKATIISENELYNSYIKDNLTIAQVAKKYGCTSKYMGDKIREYGIHKKTRWEWITRDMLYEYYITKNLYISEIARELKCSRAVVESRLKMFSLLHSKTSEAENTCQIRRAAIALKSSSARSKYEDELREMYPTNFLNIYDVINKELDLYYPEKKVAIEFNGDFWHSETYKKGCGKKHYVKLKRCTEKGIRLINITEYLWKDKLSKAKIINILDNAINRDKLLTPLGYVKVVSKDMERIFVKENNLNTYSKSDICLGTFNMNNDLINTLSFIKLGNNTYKIKCFSTKIGYMEDYNKVLEYFISTYIPNEIIVSCDRRYYDFSLFGNLGFHFVKYTQIVPKFVYNKHSISCNTYNKNPEKYLKYHKIYDCGKATLKWQAN